MAKLFYPKIRTLYNRGDDFKIPTAHPQYTLPVFGNIRNWLLTEKVDGTNASIWYDTETRSFGVRGRTERADVGMWKVAYEQLCTATIEDTLALICYDYGLKSIEVFGEAFGPGIQSGGWYADKQSFIIYDVRVNGTLWLPWEQVVGTADTLSLRTVPVVQSNATIPFTVHLVRQGFKSSLTKDDRPCEGIVARPSTGELRLNNGERVVFKLKHKDYA